MSLFAVTYAHPDPVGWQQHLAAHLDWIVEQVDAGVLLASGPTTQRDTAIRTAALIFHCSDDQVLNQLLETDPYVVHGQVSNMEIVSWDPIFGILNSKSSRRNESAESIVADILSQYGPSSTG
jgi:uncharacterized protein YciI